LAEEQQSEQERYNEWAQGLAAQRAYGGGDRLGSLNLLDGAARMRARSAIRSGETVSLCRPIRNGNSARNDGEPAFSIQIHTSEREGGSSLASEHVELDCHGSVNTHIDALNHLGYFGHWYNGLPLADRTDSQPSVVDFAQLGIFARAIHADIPAVRGVPWITPEQPVTGDDIDQALSMAGVTFSTGDALLLDSGRDRYEQVHGDWGLSAFKGGPGSSAGEWLADNRVSLLLWDMMDAVNATGVRGAIHKLHWAIGMVLVDNCDFSSARVRMTELEQHSAGLTVAPLPYPNGTGCNVNPLLIL
jgi:kynurenine formamidase